MTWTPLALLGTVATFVIAAAVPASTPTPDASNTCAEVTPASLTKQIRLIEAALVPARRDADKFGGTGTYAVAARNARDLLQRSLERMQEAVRKLNVADPSTTNYAEGGEMKEMIRYTFEWLSQAGHWALISATYHKSPDARNTFIATIPTLNNATVLYNAAGRCFMSGFGL